MKNSAIKKHVLKAHVARNWTYFTRCIPAPLKFVSDKISSIDEKVISDDKEIADKFNFFRKNSSQSNFAKKKFTIQRKGVITSQARIILTSLRIVRASSSENLEQKE